VPGFTQKHVNPYREQTRHTYSPKNSRRRGSMMRTGNVICAGDTEYTVHSLYIVSWKSEKGAH